MHHLLREPFLPSNYIKTLFCEYNNCHQGAKTTKEYALEFQRLMEQNNLHETKVQIVAQFLDRLCPKIEDQVRLQLIYTLQNAI